MATRNPPVNAILVECAIAVGSGLGDKAVPTSVGKFWATKYERSIKAALAHGGIWSRDRRGVLVMSKKLGRTARRLAASDESVSLAVARRASALIARDPLCPGGGGKYCPPR